MRSSVLIDQHGAFSDVFLARESCERVKIVSSLPSQRCAKSSILDDLFDAHLVQSAAKRGRKPLLGSVGRTSKSALTIAEGNDPIVVLDAGRMNPAITSRVITLEACLSDVVILSLFSTDVGRRDAIDSEVIRSFFQDLINVSWQEELRTHLTVLVRDHDDDTDPKMIENAIIKRLNAIWKTCRFPKECSRARMTAFLEIDVWCIPHHRLRASAYEKVVRALRRSITCRLNEGSFSKMIGLDSLAMYTRYVWDSLNEPGSSLPPRFKDLITMHDSDVEVEQLRTTAMKTIQKWKDAVVCHDRCIHDFGFQASKLFDQAMKDFDDRTFQLDAEFYRKNRRDALEESLKSEIRNLFYRQLKILQRTAHTSVRRQLLGAVKATGSISQASQDSIVRRAINSFCQDAEGLEVKGLRLSAYAARVELEGALLSLAQGLISSPSAQFLAVQRQEREAQRPRRTYIPGNILDGVSLGVGLVAEIRAKGYGNAQAYYSYANGPHTVNIGYANDADAVMQEGKGVVPFLRFQPTLRFDIDAKHAYSSR